MVSRAARYAFVLWVCVRFGNLEARSFVKVYRRVGR